MPLMYFDTRTFKGRPVENTEAARRHATLAYTTENIAKMEALSPKEMRAAFALLASRD